MNHTLVIPTYNRPALLARLARYYAARLPELELLVLDSSRPAVAAENAAALAALGARIRHAVFAQTTPPATKISQGLAQVHTPYASLCADDDLVFPAGLRTALDFLDRHPDYVCAHGLCLNFHQQGSDVHLSQEYAGPDIDAGHPGARIFRLLQRYESLYYAVYRAADLRAVFSCVPALPTLVFQELYQATAAVIKGKVKRFPVFHTARQAGPPAQSDRDKWQTFYWFADDPAEVLRHYAGYREEVWKFFEANAQPPRMEKADFAKALDLAHAVYFASGCSPAYFHSVLQPHWPAERFRAIGRLDSPGRRDYRALLNWTGTGGGPQVDPLDGLRTPRSLPAWAPVRALAALWFFALAVPAGAALGREVRRASRTPWRCRLPRGISWLKATPEFRGSFLELCRYLD